MRVKYHGISGSQITNKGLRAVFLIIKPYMMLNEVKRKQNL